MKNFKAVIIEDELNNQQLLTAMLDDYCEGVEVFGIAEDVKGGIEKIKEVQPDVIFLDQQIDGGNGFDILDAFPNPDFKIIFVTGYAEHAIRAIRYSALDYILKPINLQHLKDAIGRIGPKDKDYSENFKLMKSHLKGDKPELDKIVIPSNKGYHLVNIFDIIYLKALQSYVEIVYGNHKRYLSTKSLKHYEELLPQNVFFKTHRSFIVNSDKVAHYEQGRGGEVTMLSGVKIPISSRKKSLFVKFMKQINR